MRERVLEDEESRVCRGKRRRWCQSHYIVVTRRDDGIAVVAREVMPKGTRLGCYTWLLHGNTSPVARARLDHHPGWRSADGPSVSLRHVACKIYGASAIRALVRGISRLIDFSRVIPRAIDARYLSVLDQKDGKNQQPIVANRIVFLSVSLVMGLALVSCDLLFADRDIYTITRRLFFIYRVIDASRAIRCR